MHDDGDTAVRLSERLAGQIAAVMQTLRSLSLQKAPGVAESLDWAMALMNLHRDHLDMRALAQTVGCVLKVHEDHGVAYTHAADLAAAMGETPASPQSGGYGLDTDFGFGKVSTPRH